MATEVGVEDDWNYVDMPDGTRVFKSDGVKVEDGKVVGPLHRYELHEQLYERYCDLMEEAHDAGCRLSERGYSKHDFRRKVANEECQVADVEDCRFFERSFNLVEVSTRATVNP